MQTTTFSFQYEGKGQVSDNPQDMHSADNPYVHCGLTLGPRQETGQRRAGRGGSVQVSAAKVVRRSYVMGPGQLAAPGGVTEPCIHIAHIPVKSWDLNLFKAWLYTKAFKKKQASELFKAQKKGGPAELSDGFSLTATVVTSTALSAASRPGHERFTVFPLRCSNATN